MVKGSSPSEFRKFIRDNVSKVTEREDMVKLCWKKFRKDRKKVLDAITDMQRLGQVPADVLVRPGPAPAHAPSRSKPRPIGGKRMLRLSVDISEIKKEYDEESKIEEGLKVLGTRLIKDNDFRMELEVPLERWKVVSQLPKFNAFKKELKGKRFRGLYWGNPEVIKELSKAVNML